MYRFCWVVLSMCTCRPCVLGALRGAGGVLLSILLILCSNYSVLYHCVVPQIMVAAKLAAIASRRGEVRAFQAAKPRFAVKGAALADFVKLMSSLYPGLGPGQFTDEHVETFLISREISGGRTVVHQLGCRATPRVAPPGAHGGTGHVSGKVSRSASALSCECPRRMKHDSVKGLMFALRSAMSVEWGLGTVSYDALLGTGNPAKSLRVDMYLHTLQEMQVQRGVSTSKPVLILSSKMRDLSLFLHQETRNGDLSLPQRILLCQDRCRLLAAHASTNRHQMIADTLLSGVTYHTPARNTVFFGYCWGKCLRDGGQLISRFDRNLEERFLCVVSALEEYFAFARLLRWDMSAGFLFSPILLADGGARGPGPAKVDSLATRFVAYLRRWGLYEGETLKATRAGGAVEALTTEGLSPYDVKARGGWSQRGRGPSNMLHRYTALPAVQLVAGAPAHALSAAAYKVIDEGPLRGSEVRAALAL